MVRGFRQQHLATVLYLIEQGKLFFCVHHGRHQIRILWIIVLLNVREHVLSVNIRTPETLITEFTMVRLFFHVVCLHMPFKNEDITEIWVITAFRISTFIS